MSEIDIYHIESLIKTSVNGNLLENKIEGFRTLNVFGREMLSKEVTTQKIDGRDGVAFIESSLPARVLTVEYELKGDDYEDFKSKFELLNYYLREDESEFTFTDDEEYRWLGTVNSVGEIQDYVNWTSSYFNILCSDPYKYSVDLIELTGTNQVDITIDTPYNTLPVEIGVIPANNTSTITLTNGDKEIQLVEGSFLAGEPVIIAYGENITVTSSNGDDTNKIALHSDLEEFYLVKGVPVVFEECGEIIVRTRRVML